MKLQLVIPLTIIAATLAADIPDAFLGAPTAPYCGALPPGRHCILSDENLIGQSNVYTSLSFLYWEGAEDGLEYAFKNDGTQTAQTGSMKKLHFEWEPAVRVLVGYHIPHDKWWNVDLSYTYYKTEVEDRAELQFDRTSLTPGTGLAAVWTAPFAFGDRDLGARWTNANAKWNLRADVFDLMLRHNLLLSTELSIEPAVGVKLAILKQYYKVLYSGGNTIHYLAGIEQNLHESTVSLKNRSLNIGPEFSLASRWKFGSHWSIFGTCSASLLASRFTTGRDEFDVALDGASGDILLDYVRFSNNFWAFRPETSLQLGLSWGNCYCRKDSVIYYSFSLAYEADYWWKQNMMSRYVSGNANRLAEIAPTQGDLFLQGITVEALIDF